MKIKGQMFSNRVPASVLLLVAEVYKSLALAVVPTVVISTESHLSLGCHVMSHAFDLTLYLHDRRWNSATQ